MASPIATNKPKKSQWRLSTLLILMLGFAILFGGIAQIHGVVDMEMSFRFLPKDDEKLIQWVKETYRTSDLQVTRPDAQTVKLQFKRSIQWLDVPSPPFIQFGYGPTNSFLFAQSQALSWWIPVGLAIIFFAGLLSRGLHRVAALLFPTPPKTAEMPEFADR